MLCYFEKLFFKMATESKIKSYPSYYSPTSERIRWDLSPDAKKKDNVIYQFLDEATGKSLVGRTTQFSRRISEYEGRVKREIESGKPSEFSRAVWERPHDFSVRILEQAQTAGKLNALEKKHIQNLNCIAPHGYNQNAGGGGGKKVEISDQAFIPPNQTTPDRRFPLVKKENGNLAFQISPATQKTGACVYSILNHASGKRYVGETENFKRRASEHTSHANHAAPKKARTKRELFYEEMQKTPRAFSIGVVEKEPNGAQRKLKETFVIQANDSKKSGYNSNCSTPSVNKS